ncbi:MAG: hypothetical protein ACFHX7_12450 [Pseudomonadota bacterium]
MVKNLLIVALLTSNAAFGYALYRNWQTSVPVSTTSGKPALTGPVTASVQRPEAHDGAPVSAATVVVGVNFNQDYGQLAESLRANEFDEDMIRQIISATMNRDRVLGQRNEAQQPYWKKTERNRSEDVRERLDWQSEKRAMLLDLFGDDIVNDPLFEDLFKPLNKTLPFLSSEKQIALQELELESRAQFSDLDRFGFTQENRDEMREQQRLREESIRSLLTPDEYFEYELRESRLANQMKEQMDGFDYSEYEFRDLYRLRDDLAQERSLAAATISSREDFQALRQTEEARIREYLGDDRFEAYQRAQDPTYKRLVTIGERYGNTDREIIEVYEKTSEFQEQMNTVMRDRNLTNDQRRDRLSTLQANLAKSVSDIAGDETASSVTSNLARPRGPGPGGPGPGGPGARRGPR